MKEYCIILLLLAPFCLKAQSNYKKGLIVNLKGDTLHGYIDYREWSKTPERINFKESINSKATQLDVFDINYFEINGFERYQKYNVKIGLGEVDLSKASTGPDTTSKTENVFLKILESGGTIALYSYRDNIKNRFYIKEKGADVPEELIYIIYEDSTNDTKLVTRNTYHDQLNKLVFKYNAGSSQLVKQIQQSGYNESDIISIVSKINGYSKKQVSIATKNNSNDRFFIGAAFNESKLKYQGDINFATSNGSTSGSPKIVLGFDAFVNPNVGSLIFRMELGFLINNYSFTETSDDTYDAKLETSTQKIKQITTSVSPQLIYNFYNTDVFKVFFDAGFSFNISSYPTNTNTTTNLQSINPKNNYPELRSFWASIPLKAGFVIDRKVEIYGTYFLNTSLTEYSSFSGELSSFQVGINYLLGK